MSQIYSAIHRILFGDQPYIFLVEIAVRTFVIFIFTLVLLRWMGKRGLSQLSPFEFVIIVSLGSAVGDPMLYGDTPLIHAMLVILVVVCLQRALGRLTQNNAQVEQFIESRSELLVQDGLINAEQLHRERLSINELFEMLRLDGIAHLGQVRQAFLEPSGKLSVIRRRRPIPGLSTMPEVGPGIQLDETRDWQWISCNHCGATTQADTSAKFVCAPVRSGILFGSLPRSKRLVPLQNRRRLGKQLRPPRPEGLGESTGFASTGSLALHLLVSHPLHATVLNHLSLHDRNNNVGNKRISESMEQALNDQMNREAFQAQVYLAYGSWAEVNGFPGISAFLYKHSQEERKHMFKFLKFINVRGGKSRIESIDAPPVDPKDLHDCLQKTLQHEIDNSKSIDAIVNQALEEKDWATFNFGQWFVREQIEEETLVSELLDKYLLAARGQEKTANLYALDRDMCGAPQEAEIPREAEL